MAGLRPWLPALIALVGVGVVVWMQARQSARVDTVEVATGIAPATSEDAARSDDGADAARSVERRVAVADGTATTTSASSARSRSRRIRRRRSA